MSWAQGTLGIKTYSSINRQFWFRFFCNADFQSFFVILEFRMCVIWERNKITAFVVVIKGMENGDVGMVMCVSQTHTPCGFLLVGTAFSNCRGLPIIFLDVLGFGGPVRWHKKVNSTQAGTLWKGLVSILAIVHHAVWCKMSQAGWEKNQLRRVSRACSKGSFIQIYLCNNWRKLDGGKRWGKHE